LIVITPTKTDRLAPSRACVQQRGTTVECKSATPLKKSEWLRANGQPTRHAASVQHLIQYSAASVQHFIQYSAASVQHLIQYSAALGSDSIRSGHPRNRRVFIRAPAFKHSPPLIFPSPLTGSVPAFGEVRPSVFATVIHGGNRQRGNSNTREACCWGTCMLASRQKQACDPTAPPPPPSLS
jgi:hypothetical protein